MLADDVPAPNLSAVLSQGSDATSQDISGVGTLTVGTINATTINGSFGEVSSPRRSSGRSRTGS